eukprot:scaffold19923_cov107-Isochrysis_galbana.AAC.3
MEIEYGNGIAKCARACVRGAPWIPPAKLSLLIARSAASPAAQTLAPRPRSRLFKTREPRLFHTFSPGPAVLVPGMPHPPHPFPVRGAGRHPSPSSRAHASQLGSPTVESAVNGRIQPAPFLPASPHRCSASKSTHPVQKSSHSFKETIHFLERSESITERSLLREEHVLYERVVVVAVVRLLERRERLQQPLHAPVGHALQLGPLVRRPRHPLPEALDLPRRGRAGQPQRGAVGLQPRVQLAHLVGEQVHLRLVPALGRVQHHQPGPQCVDRVGQKGERPAALLERGQQEAHLLLDGLGPLSPLGLARCGQPPRPGDGPQLKRVEAGPILPRPPPCLVYVRKDLDLHLGQVDALHRSALSDHPRAPPGADTLTPASVRRHVAGFGSRSENHQQQDVVEQVDGPILARGSRVGRERELALPQKAAVGQRQAFGQHGAEAAATPARRATRRAAPPGQSRSRAPAPPPAAPGRRRPLPGGCGQGGRRSRRACATVHPAGHPSWRQQPFRGSPPPPRGRQWGPPPPPPAPPAGAPPPPRAPGPRAAPQERPRRRSGRRRTAGTP